MTFVLVSTEEVTEVGGHDEDACLSSSVVVGGMSCAQGT